MRVSKRVALHQFLLVLALKSLPVGASAEEFKYYVWMDEQGIVHAQEEPPKGVDYEVRIIEDVNANVVPAEDFRVYEAPPGGFDSGSGGDRQDDETGGAGQSEAIVPRD